MAGYPSCVLLFHSSCVLSLYSHSMIVRPWGTESPGEPVGRSLGEASSGSMSKVPTVGMSGM